ncbi:UNVERIFIED_CONTAM: hypothetical protein Scaly_0444700 [Sesamum calycinum]|uniref:Uncharacterized protein n=1 Tax=Sesamum calycinum TaxID=2727403 RepID=A0AAW2SEC7_9LAMI
MFAVMEMDPKDMEDEWSAAASPIEVLQQLSQEAVRLAGEAWQSAYPGGPLVNPSTLEQPRHRRAHSEVVVSSYRRSISSSNFHKWKSQMQKALHWGGRSLRVDSQYSSFNPEVLANQKRQWYQLNSKTMMVEKVTSQLLILIVNAKLEAVEDAFIRKKKWEQEMERTETVDFDMRKRRQPSFPTLDPQENKNDLLQIICAYHCMHLPERGSEIIFRPLEHLQAIVYRRPPVSSLGLCDKYLDLEIKDSKEASQADAAAQFLIVMNRYLESLCADLRLHTITSVQSNNDKVSILLKDSFIDSFPAKDQPFIKDYKDLI